MLTGFFDIRGIVHHEYAPEGQTVTKEYYQDVLRRLRDADLTCGQRKTGNCITTMPPHIHPT